MAEPIVEALIMLPTMHPVRFPDRGALWVFKAPLKIDNILIPPQSASASRLQTSGC